jgi:hypothetical protein
MGIGSREPVEPNHEFSDCLSHEDIRDQAVKSEKRKGLFEVNQVHRRISRNHESGREQ